MNDKTSDLLDDIRGGIWKIESTVSAPKHWTIYFERLRIELDSNITTIKLFGGLISLLLLIIAIKLLFF
jgi:hypothetical protein